MPALGNPYPDPDFATFEQNRKLWLETCLAEQAMHLLFGETEAGVSMFHAEFLVLMCIEIYNPNASARCGHSCRFIKGGSWTVGEVQDLVKKDGVEAIGREWQACKIALDDFQPIGGNVLQLRARHTKHGETLIECNDMVGFSRKKLGHSARAGPDVQQTPETPFAQRISERLLDLLIGRMEAAKLVPIVRMTRKILLRLRLPRHSNFRKFRAISFALLVEFPIERFRLCEEAGNIRADWGCTP